MLCGFFVLLHMDFHKLIYDESPVDNHCVFFPSVPELFPKIPSNPVRPVPDLFPFAA